MSTCPFALELRQAIRTLTIPDLLLFLLHTQHGEVVDVNICLEQREQSGDDGTHEPSHPSRDLSLLRNFFMGIREFGDTVQVFDGDGFG